MFDVNYAAQIISLVFVGSAIMYVFFIVANSKPRTELPPLTQEQINQYEQERYESEYNDMVKSEMVLRVEGAMTEIVKDLERKYDCKIGYYPWDEAWYEFERIQKKGDSKD